MGDRRRVPPVVVYFVLLVGLFWVPGWMGWFSGWTGLAAWIGAALLLLAPYWLGPIQVRSALRHPAEPTFELYDPPRHAAPPEAVAYVDQAAQALGGLGFTGATRLVEATWTPAATALVTIAEHRQMQDVAMAAALYTTRRPHVVKSRYVEFVAKWSNGRQLVTNDNAEPPIYPPVRHRILTQLPGLSDPGRLFRIHQVLATRSAPAAKAALPDEWAPVSRLSAAMLESVAGADRGRLHVFRSRDPPVPADVEGRPAHVLEAPAPDAYDPAGASPPPGGGTAPRAERLRREGGVTRSPCPPGCG
jgi:hypothetical protein